MESKLSRSLSRKPFKNIHRIESSLSGIILHIRRRRFNWPVCMWDKPSKYVEFLLLSSVQLTWAEGLYALFWLTFFRSPLSSSMSLLSLSWTFHIFFSRPTGQFNLAQSILCKRWFNSVQMKVLAFCKREKLFKKAKTYWRNLKIFASRTSGLISTK